MSSYKRHNHARTHPSIAHHNHLIFNSSGHLIWRCRWRWDQQMFVLLIIKNATFSLICFTFIPNYIHFYCNFCFPYGLKRTGWKTMRVCSSFNHKLKHQKTTNNIIYFNPLKYSILNKFKPKKKKKFKWEKELCLFCGATIKSENGSIIYLIITFCSPSMWHGKWCDDRELIAYADTFNGQRYARKRHKHQIKMNSCSYSYGENARAST